MLPGPELRPIARGPFERALDERIRAALLARTRDRVPSEGLRRGLLARARGRSRPPRLRWPESQHLAPGREWTSWLQAIALLGARQLL